MNVPNPFSDTTHAVNNQLHADDIAVATFASPAMAKYAGQAISLHWVYARTLEIIAHDASVPAIDFPRIARDALAEGAFAETSEWESRDSQEIVIKDIDFISEMMALLENDSIDEVKGMLFDWSVELEKRKYGIATNDPTGLDRSA